MSNRAKLHPVVKFWIGAALLAAVSGGLDANTEAETLCKPWGGLKKIQSTSERKTPMFTYRSLEVECNDGSWISRAVYPKK